MSWKLLYTAHAAVEGPSLNRGRMVETVTVGRLVLGRRLDGGLSPHTPRTRPGLGSSWGYATPGGVGLIGQGVEIKDREPRREDDRKPRVWGSK